MSLSKDFHYLAHNSGKKIVVDENIFRYKSRHITTNGEMLYFQCIKAEKGCRAKIKNITEEGEEKVQFLPNHLNDTDRIGIANLKRFMCRRAAEKPK
jgi:hypothetical protein